VETWAAKDLIRAVAARWEARRKHKWRTAAAAEAVVVRGMGKWKREGRMQGRQEEVTWWKAEQVGACVEKGLEDGRNRSGDEQAWPVRRPHLYLAGNPLGWRGIHMIGEEALMRRADILLSLGWKQKGLFRLLRKDRIVAVLDDRLTIGLGLGLSRWFTRWDFI
jgi:hypothetical protein